MAKKGKVGTLDAAAQYVKNKLPQVGFFSTLDELISQAPFEKAPLSEWKNYLKPGRELVREDVRFPLKKEELDYSWPTGTELPSGFITEHTPLTKDEIRESVRRRRPDFRVKVGMDSRVRGDNGFDSLDFRNQRFPEEVSNAKSVPYAVDRVPPEITDARYSDWAHTSEAGNYEESATRSTDFGPTSDSQHFGPDVISHSRTTIQPTIFQEPEDPQERMMRLIEEIQSDRHQEASERIYQGSRGATYTDPRPGGLDNDGNLVTSLPWTRRGYRTPEESKELSQIERMGIGVEPGLDEETEREAFIEADRRKRRYDELKKKVPDAPFKDPADYGLLELKMQMLNAAKGGQDYLGLVRGKDISKRFSQSPEDAAGTSYVYDKIYPSVMRKLAAQYGANVRDVPTTLTESVDVTTPTMRNFDTETIHDFMDQIYGHLEDLPKGESVAGNTGSVQGVLDELRAQDPIKAKEGDQLLKRIRGSVPESPTFLEAWRRLTDTLEDLHLSYREMTKEMAGPPAAKTFESMELTPELREKIKRIGVPIWALAGTAAGLAAQKQAEEPGYAEGGEVSGLDRLRELADVTGGVEEGGAERNRRMLSGLASQWYGMNSDSGEPELFGGDLKSLIPGVGAWREAHGQPRYKGAPGILDEVQSMFLGTDKADAADERLTALKEKIRQKMQLEEASGFQQNFDESMGVMLGQFPVPAGRAKAGIDAVTKLEKLKKILRVAPDSVIEWFSPTVAPSAANYLAGSTVGGGIGTLADTPPVKKAEGGSVKGTKPLHSMLDLLKARLVELNPDVPSMASVSDNSATEDPMKKIGGFAKGGKVKTLLELREMLARNLDGPGVEGTGRELASVEPPVTANPVATTERATPEALIDLVKQPTPAIPSAPFQMNRRDFLQGASSLLMPGDIPLDPKAAIIKQLTKAVSPERHPLYGTVRASGDLEQMFTSAEAEDYGEAIQGLDEIFQQYPREQTLGIRSAMMAVQQHLEKHGDDLYDLDSGGEIEEELMRLGEIRDKKIEGLGKVLGFRMNPSMNDEFVFDPERLTPKNPQFMHDRFIPESEELIPYGETEHYKKELRRAEGLDAEMNVDEARIDALLKSDEMDPNEFFLRTKEAAWDRPSAWNAFMEKYGHPEPPTEDGDLAMRELEPEEIEYLEKIFGKGNIPEELLHDDWDT